MRIVSTSTGSTGESVGVGHRHPVTAERDTVGRVGAGVDEAQPGSAARWYIDGLSVLERAAVDQVQRIADVAGVAAEQVGLEHRHRHVS